MAIDIRSSLLPGGSVTLDAPGTGLAGEKSAHHSVSQDVRSGTAARGVSGAAPDENPKVVPDWQEGFSLDTALVRAYNKATAYMNDILAPDDMRVDMELRPHDGTDWEEGIVGVFREEGSGRVLKTTAGEQLLKLYAHNLQKRGIIVDGAL